MKTIQVRNVPDDVHRVLRARAAGAGASLSDYVLETLVRAASRPTLSDTIDRARTRTGRAPAAEIVAAVRSGRDRDS